jgi:hypothetical protein
MRVIVIATARATGAARVGDIKVRLRFSAATGPDVRV